MSAVQHTLWAMGVQGLKLVHSVAKLAPKGPNKTMLGKPKIFSVMCLSIHLGGIQRLRKCTLL
jgi:hypothetical protein